MRDVSGLFVVVVAFLVGRVGGMEPNSGYCIRNQCFSAFQEPSDYKAAEDQCGALGSHLMTVRSTVSQDILTILLGKLKGMFWIGLHRTTGCPDAAAELKGYQWVTNDNESDFSNWATTFDSSCSSHRCVSVSADDDFKWTQEPCDEAAVGFLCEYTFSEPCNGLKAADGESITYKTPLGFGGDDLLSLPPGSTAIRMPAETKYICFTGQWLQAPWNCEIEEGGCEHRCAMDPNNMPSCYCPAGQTVSPANKVTCEVAIDDPCLPLSCAHTCYENGGSYACLCDHGFKLGKDGRSCLDINDCSDDRQCPGENFMCVNTVGGFQCVCMDGYRMTGDQCLDVDECASAPCEHMCTNTPGSYECSCYDRYIPDPKAPQTCKLHCGKKECVAECDPNDRFQCYCPEGYIAEERPSETVCIDMDECFSFFCDQHCKNTFGSYVCTCSPGYMLVDQYKCIKIEDGTDSDDGTDGSGASTIPSMFTAAPAPDPEPTKRPSAVSVGGLVGIIVSAVFFIVLLVFLVHHVCGGRGKMESAGALKASENEAHSLRRVTSDT